MVNLKVSAVEVAVAAAPSLVAERGSKDDVDTCVDEVALLVVACVDEVALLVGACVAVDDALIAEKTARLPGPGASNDSSVG